MHLKIINFFFYFFLIQFNNNILFASDIKTGVVELKKSNTVFKVEIANTQMKRSKGLMFRSELDIDRGMLFVFPAESYVSVWMKNTLISLDIIFISKNMMVVDLVEKASPMSKDIYTSKENTKYILEINSGLIKSLNINLGDKINIEY